MTRMLSELGHFTVPQYGSLLHVPYSGCINTGGPIAEQDSSSTVLLERLIVFQKPAPLTLYGRPKIADTITLLLPHPSTDGRSFSLYMLLVISIDIIRACEDVTRATIPTFEAASWTPRPSLIDTDGLEILGGCSARTEDLDTRLFLRLFLTTHNSARIYGI